jgi:translation initiation factor 4A
MTSEIKSYDSFEEMDLSTNVLRGIFAYGWEYPSPIQKKIIVPIINKGDIIAQAQSGTGKTGAFSISSLQRIDWSVKKPQIIVISPTRELALQTYNTASNIGCYQFKQSGTRCSYAIGGTSVTNDIQALKNNNIVFISATPGRIYDIINRKVVSFDSVKMVILDEADEMLSQGFKEQVHNILAILPKTVQIALFSATMAPDVLEIAETFMKDPLKLLIAIEDVPVQGIKQFIVELEEDDKLGVLMDLYERVSINQSIIFVNSKRKVEWLSKKMSLNNFTVSSIHSAMEKDQREGIMANFRNGKTRVLIATDLLSRGIDVHHISIVVNYDLPTNYENYIHRIGRAGRYGRKGLTINFITPNDGENLKGIETLYHIKIEELPDDFEKFLH